MTQFLNSETPRPSYISYGSFDKDKWDFEGGDDNKAYLMPKINWSHNRNRTAGGDFLSEEIKVQLNGLITVSGNPEMQKLIERTINFHESIMDNNGEPFEYVFNEHHVVTGYANVANLSFNDNQNYWRDYVSYTLDLVIPVSGTGSYLTNDLEDDHPGNSNYYISNCQDSYSIDENDDVYSTGPLDYDYYPTYTLTRRIGATAKSIDVGVGENKSGSLVFAQAWVNKRANKFPMYDFLPYNKALATTFGLFNQKRSLDFSESEGSYNISDTFLLKHGADPWLYTNTINSSVDGPNLLRKVNIQGEVVGLEPATGIYKSDYDLPNSSGVHNISGMILPADYKLNSRAEIPYRETENITKYENAVSGYVRLCEDDAFYESAIRYDAACKASINEDILKKGTFSFKGRPLHGIPVENSESYFPQEGKLGFSKTFDSRPTGMLKGSLFESFTLSDSKPQTLISPVNIIGRRLGPLYYNTLGYTNQAATTFASGVGSRTVVFEAFFPKPTGLESYRFPQGDVDKIDKFMMLYKPKGKFTGYIVEDSQNLDLTSNKLTKTIKWDYVICGDN